MARIPLYSHPDNTWQGTSLSADEIGVLLTKGDDSKKPPHKKPMSSLSADDAKAVADFVKSLK